jgi:uncharacterized protein (UPF0333 family)
MLRNKKGQSTLEYVILVAGIILIIIWFVGANNSPFQNALNSTLQQATNGMEDMANRLRGSRPPAP